MYPTESFVWSLGYVKDWTDARYDSIHAQIAAKRAAGTTNPRRPMTAAPIPCPANGRGRREGGAALILAALAGGRGGGSSYAPTVTS